MRKWSVLSVTMLLAAAALAQATGSAPVDKPAATAPVDKPAVDKPAGPEEGLGVIKAVAGALVRVEFTFQYDKGQAPRFFGWSLNTSAEESIREERPAEMTGYLVAPGKVVAPDPMVHPRFVKSIAVRSGEQVAPAKIAAYARAHNAIVLELSGTLKGARPLAFDAKADPAHLVSANRVNGVWTTSVGAMPTHVSVADDKGANGGAPPSETSKRKFVSAPYCLVTDEKGVPVGLCMTGELPVDGSWKGSPLNWPAVTQAEMDKLLTQLQQGSDQCLLRVKVSFRSPRKGAGRSYSRFSPGDDETATELDALGVLTGDKQVMVLANLKPNTTARLERITVHPPAGEGVPAKFAGTLTHYGAFLAALEKPLPAPAKLASADVLGYRNVLLPAVEIELQGENRQAYFAHRRITGFDIGWRQQVYPNVAADRMGSERLATFLFNDKGELLVLPVVRREKVSEERGYGGEQPSMTAAGYLRGVLGDLARNLDASNVPLTEEEENRLAWLGVELQALNRDLARANGVSDLTQDGRTGALVAYVYPDSPADKAGLKAGCVLLRLHVPDQPKPIDVQLSEGYAFADRPFPWQMLDQVPESRYDDIPTPWPPTETEFTRKLTDLGFGKKFTAEFFADGKSLRKDFEVVQSPPHYLTAPKYKAQAIGLTVRDMTYEVRRYFQKTADDLGVIVSKLEPGSRASVAGVKPYELITHVNDKPVKNVKDFENLIAGQDELRLSVLRMTKGRIVKLKTTGPASLPTGAPGPAPAPEPGLED